MDNIAVFFIAITDGLILIQRAAKRYPLSAMALAVATSGSTGRIGRRGSCAERMAPRSASQVGSSG